MRALEAELEEFGHAARAESDFVLKGAKKKKKKAGEEEEGAEEEEETED